jgi:predicted GIY-YIG superfamily endonuclease
MAVLAVETENDVENENVLDRLATLELIVDDLTRNVDELALTKFMTDYDRPVHDTFTSTNIFPSSIKDNMLIRGEVKPCFEKIVERLERNGKNATNLYIGATCDPQRRFKEHFRSSVKNNTSFAQKGTMELLYGTSRMERAAEMESRLLMRFKTSGNSMRMSSGLAFGKPSYFVYLLRHFKKV